MELLQGKTLARMLPGCASSNVREKILGLCSEQQRVGTRPFIVIRTSRMFDIDGCVDLVEILDSFDTLSEAENAAKADFAYLNSDYALNRDYLPCPLTADEAARPVEGSVFAVEFFLTRRPFNREIFLLEVFGPFPDGSISRAAFAHFSALSSSRAMFDPLMSLLSVYFFSRGGDVIRKGGP